MSMLLSSRITNGNREQGRLDLDSYSGSRVLPRKVVERNLTLIVGGAQQGPPPFLGSLHVRESFRSKRGGSQPPPFPPLFSAIDRSATAPTLQSSAIISIAEKGEIYRVHATRAFHQHMSCYLRARHYSLPDLLYFMLRGWTRNSFESFPTAAIRSRRSRGNTKCV